MKKFEYYTEYFPDWKKLNELGQKGWELVCVKPNDYYIFKREIIDKTDYTICSQKNIENHMNEIWSYTTNPYYCMMMTKLIV